MASVGNIRGLNTFIADIRACKTKEQELQRVDKELGKIRNRFVNSKWPLTEYERKKYVFKILYTYMLGYDVDFGHMEALNLLTSSKYSEKQVGYLWATILLNENDTFLINLINSIRNDIISRNEAHQALALTCVANRALLTTTFHEDHISARAILISLCHFLTVGSQEFAEALSNDVQGILVSSTARLVVRKKAALCLLRLYKRDKDMLNADVWSETLVNLLEERDLGLLLSVMSLLEVLVADNAADFSSCMRKVGRVLDRLVKHREIPAEYTYYGIPSPWLQVRCIRVLKFFNIADDPKTYNMLLDIVKQILRSASTNVKNLNKHNAIHAVLFEAINLSFSFDTSGEVMQQCVDYLARFISMREANIRYLGLEVVARFSLIPEVMERMKSHQKEIMNALYDEDISIKRRALEMLYAITEEDNAEVVVEQLLDYLPTSDLNLREEIVVKVAMVAERFRRSGFWYVDTVARLIDLGAEYVSDDVWHSLVQMIANSGNQELQKHAAGTFAEMLYQGKRNEMLIKVAAYVLGEYGTLLSEDPRHYFQALTDQIPVVEVETKSIMVTSFAKIATKTSDMQFKREVNNVLSRFKSVMDVELQQRSTEFSELNTRGANAKTLREVMGRMPAFPERTSKLERRQDQAGRTNEARHEQTDSPSETSGLPAPHSAMQEGDLLEASADTGTSAPTDTNTVNGPQDSSRMLDELYGPAPSQLVSHQQQSQAGAQQANGDFDLLSMGQEQETAGGANIAPTLDVRTQLKKFYGNNTAKLYEDPYLQLGVKASYEEGQGTLALYLGNKHSAKLTNFILQLPSSHEGLKIQLQGNIPAELPAKQQQVVTVKLECVKPYESPPGFRISYTVADTTESAGSINLTLPAFVTKFVKPNEGLTSGAFGSTWTNITERGESPVKQGVTFGPQISRGGERTLRYVLRCLGLGAIEESEQQHTIRAAGRLVMVNQGQGASAPVMAMVEQSQRGGASLSVLSSDQLLSKGVASGLSEAVSL